MAAVSAWILISLIGLVAGINFDITPVTARVFSLAWLKRDEPSSVLPTSVVDSSPSDGDMGSP